MPPSFLYFDLGNVLLNFDHMTACRQMGEVAGIPAERVYEIVFDDGIEMPYERGKIDSRGFYELFCEQSDTKPDYDELTRAGCEIFDLNVRIVPIVAALRWARYRMGILSNICQSHWEYCSDGRFGVIPALFDRTALSYQIGAMKPDEEMYMAAAEMAEVAPEEVFFVDDRADLVAGAREVGYDAIQFTTPAALAAELRNRGLTFNY